jgi:hypothetical protein
VRIWTRKRELAVLTRRAGLVTAGVEASAAGAGVTTGGGVA